MTVVLQPKGGVDLLKHIDIQIQQNNHTQKASLEAGMQEVAF